MANSNSTLEDNYKEASSLEHRKKYGQYFTPPFISELMALWVSKSAHCKIVLDPAVGTGGLLTSLPETCNIEGFDLDPIILQYARENVTKNRSVRLYHQDFLLSDWEEKYDGIICNPPYVRFKYYNEKQAYLKLFEKKTGIKLSGFTNIYVLFMIKALHQLKDFGRAAFIVPSDFLNSGYGTKIKQFFLEQKGLQLIAVTDYTIN